MAFALAIKWFAWFWKLFRYFSFFFTWFFSRCRSFAEHWVSRNVRFMDFLATSSLWSVVFVFFRLHFSMFSFCMSLSLFLFAAKKRRKKEELRMRQHVSSNGFASILPFCIRFSIRFKTLRFDAGENYLFISCNEETNDRKKQMVCRQWKVFVSLKTNSDLRSQIRTYAYDRSGKKNW